MSRMLKIMHIDHDFNATYLIYRERSSIRTSVPLKTAIDLIKKEDFDLIISEPHNKAILKKGSSELDYLKQTPLMEVEHGGIREVRIDQHP